MTKKSKKDYNSPLEQALEALARKRPHMVDSATVSRLCELVREHGLARASMKVRGRSCAPGLTLALAERSFAERHGDSRLMTELAELAILAADWEVVVTDGLSADWRAEAWLASANAKRIKGDHPSAEKAFREASEAIRQGTGDPYLRARRDRLLASLRSVQERRAEAAVLYRRAADQYFALGSGHEAGRCLISTGRVYHEEGEPGIALTCLVEGLRLVEPAREAHLGAVALNIAAHILMESGHHRAAYALLRGCRLLFDFSGKVPSTLSLRLRAMWAKLECDHGNLEAGLGELYAVRDAMLEADLALGAARLNFDLAVRLVPRGRSREAADLLAECLPLFICLALPEEAIVALRLLEEAVKGCALPSAVVLTRIHRVRAKYLL